MCNMIVVINILSVMSVQVGECMIAPSPSMQAVSNMQSHPWYQHRQLHETHELVPLCG